MEKIKQTKQIASERVADIEKIDKIGSHRQNEKRSGELKQTELPSHKKYSPPTHYSSQEHQDQYQSLQEIYTLGKYDKGFIKLREGRNTRYSKEERGKFYHPTMASQAKKKDRKGKKKRPEGMKLYKNSS